MEEMKSGDTGTLRSSGEGNRGNTEQRWRSTKMNV